MKKPKYQYVFMPWKKTADEVLDALKKRKFTSYHAVINALTAEGYVVNEPKLNANATVVCFELHNGKFVAYPSIHLHITQN